MSKTFWAAVVAIAVILGGIFWFTGSHNKSTDNSSNGHAVPTEHVEGKSTTGVKLVEYGDYQCPYCFEYEPVVEQVVKDYGNLISFQFRNFPLAQHQNARAGARAAEAAALQGKFWQMHDTLYQNQDPNGQTGWVASNNPITYFDGFAKQIGLNVNKFDSDFQSSKVNDLINADLAEGNKLGVNATPTFYLDGKQVNNSLLIDQSARPSLAKFIAVINAEIQKKTGKSSPVSANGSTNTTTSQ